MPNPTVDYIVDPLPGLGTSPFEIQAYRIHVPAGIPALPGGAVVLIAHEIVFDDGAVLDVSGTPGGSQVKAASGQSIGASGVTGSQGYAGQDAGSISLYAKVITGTASLIGNGGAGGPGQDGGDGVRGQNGIPGEDGDDGGSAGAGGKGGEGGKGGAITVLAADLTGATLSVSVLGGPGGAPGNTGQPGAGGAAGTQGPKIPRDLPVQGGAEAKPHLNTGPRTRPGRRGYAPPSLGPGITALNGSAASTTDAGGLINAILPLLTNSYWSMLLTNANDLYYDDSYADAAGIYSWISTIGSNGTTPVDGDVSRARVLLTQMQSGLDVYGHPRNYVQALSVGTYESNNAALVNDGIALENALAAYQAEKAAEQARLAALNISVQQAQNQVVKNATDRAALIAQGESLTQQLKELLTDQTAAMNAVNQTSAELQEALSAGQSCSFSEIISAVTLIITVASAVSGTGSAFSVALAIASAASTADKLANPPELPSLQPAINAATFIGSVEAEEDPSPQLISAYADLKASLGGKAPDPGSDNTKFIMSDSDLANVKAQFEAKIKPLPESPEKDAYNDAVDSYLNVVQTRNQLLLTFDGLAFKVASLDDSTSTLQTKIAALNSELLAAEQADVAALEQDVKDVRDGLLRSVYFELLQQSRALDFWTLSPQNPPAEYESFQVLQGILGDLTERKQAALEAFANPPASISSAAGGLIVPLSSADKAALAATGAYSFLISVDNPAFSNLAQVLAGQVTVTFIAADGSSISPMRLNLEHSGYHKFRDVHGAIYEFVTPPRTVVQNTGGTIQTSAQFSGVDTSLDPSNPAAAAYVGVSPFTRWKITVMNDPGVYAALGNAKQLSLTISGTARALVGAT